MATTNSIPALTERQILARLKKRDRLLAEVKSLQAEADDIRAEVLAWLSDRVTFDGGTFRVKVSTYSQTRVDSSRLKAEAPDVYARFSKSVETSRLTYSYR